MSFACSKSGESQPFSIGTILSVIRKDLLLFKCSNAFLKLLFFTSFIKIKKFEITESLILFQIASCIFLL